MIFQPKNNAQFVSFNQNKTNQMFFHINKNKKFNLMIIQWLPNTIFIQHFYNNWLVCELFASIRTKFEDSISQVYELFLPTFKFLENIKMFNDNYVNLNSMKGIRDLIAFDFNFFYNDKLILDLPTKVVNDEILYKKLTTKLQSKGFNILFKGITSNTYFGIPNNAMRLLIICSKNRTFLDLNDLEKIAIPHNFIAPIALLYGKKVNKLEKEYFNLAAKLDIPNNAPKNVATSDIVPTIIVVSNLYSSPSPVINAIVGGTATAKIHFNTVKTLLFNIIDPPFCNKKRLLLVF